MYNKVISHSTAEKMTFYWPNVSLFQSGMDLFAGVFAEYCLLSSVDILTEFRLESDDKSFVSH